MKRPLCFGREKVFYETINLDHRRKMVSKKLQMQGAQNLRSAA